MTAIGKRIEQLGHRHSPWNVFSDFVEIAAISISNAVDLAQRDARETRYMEITKRYTAEEMAAFPEMFGELVFALEGGFDDVLGRLFHDLELHNKYQGQFFTPYSLCRMMAWVTIGKQADGEQSAAELAIAERGYLTILEPACGSGAMLIASAEALKDAGINYQERLHATLVDVDSKCVHMAYVQLSLLHMPAVVVHGNSLSLEEHSHWYTPAHILDGWTWRLRAASNVRDVAPADESTGEGDAFERSAEAETGQLVFL
jgi:type I restriction-modification system DNA methylase subunit